MATSQEVQTDLRSVRNGSSTPDESRYATSPPPHTFALRFFSRSVKEKVQRMHLVFLKPGIWQRPQVAINNSTKKNHFEKQA